MLGPKNASYAVSLSGSLPAIDCRFIAALATERSIGPAVSCDAEIGPMPYPGTSPTVGRIPTRLCAPDGLMIEPEVSVPTVSIDSAAALAVPDPDDDPLGFWSASRPWTTWPVRLEKPDGWLPKLLAYSDRPSLPRITVPLARNFFTTPESSSGKELRSEKLPFDVYMPLASMRSLSRTGRPCATPRTAPSARSSSSTAASFSASLLSCVTALSPG